MNRVNKIKVILDIVASIIIIIAGFVVIKNYNNIQSLWKAAVWFDHRLTRIETDVSDIKKKRKANVTITAYSSQERQTDSTPGITAYMTTVKNRTIALPWYLVQQDWIPKNCVYLKINDWQYGGIYRINDQMNDRYQYRADIYFDDNGHAVAFGVLYNVDMIYLGECP